MNQGALAGLTLRPATHADYSDIARIESEAATRFADFGYPQLVRSQTDTPKEIAHYLAGKTVYLAGTQDGQAVGFCAGAELGGIFWIYAMSVLPEYGQRGIGRGLLDRMVERANWAYHRAVGLSTFSDIPFAAPFLSKAGFIAVDPTELKDGAHDEIYRQYIREIPDRVPVSERVLMIKYL